MLEQMPFEPTDQQIKLTAALARFCSTQTPSDTVFILNGYAGTGKTSVIGALVRTLDRSEIGTVLLASTGRAAKVLAGFTGFPAHTIHRKIYSSASFGADGTPSVARINRNPHSDTIFIVDEASMIGSGNDSGLNLLQDLVMYVYTGHNCRLILIGDTAQLPPVGSVESPAMSAPAFKEMGLKVLRATITRTVRQGRDSGILYNATALRRSMQQEPLPLPVLTATPFSDVEIVDPEELEDKLGTSYSRYGEEQTIMITRSNRRAVDFNMAIRKQIFDREEPLVKGDRLLISKNNYYWSTRARKEREEGSRRFIPDFLANGEAAVVNAIYGTEMYADIRFADVNLYLPESEAYIDAKIIVDSLTAETPGMPPDRLQAIGYRVIADAGVSNCSRTAQIDALKKSPHYNALQVKFAYAVTCHKAQGGQWESVFVDMGFIPAEAYTSTDFYRWLYTSITRASRHLSLLNPACEVK